MAASDFKTIPDELLHVAADAEIFYQGEGYNVEVEKKRLGFPLTPALLCTRGHETLIVEVGSTIDRKRLDWWLRFCMSQTVDTRFTLFLRQLQALPQEDIAYVHEVRMGLRVHNDIQHMEVRAPSDLAVHVALPAIKDLPPKVRPLLGGAFKKVDNDWRDGLSDAYSEVEQHAREYLKAGIRAGRIVIDKTKRGVVVGQVTEEEVDAMTLGALKDHFKRIQIQNQKDSLIGSTLDMINKTRVGLAHKKRAAAVEAQLRLEVGQHMYAVITCLDELTS